MASAAAASDGRFSAEDFPALRVALVHYWLMTWRGGERVLQSILDLFPQADIYTLFYDPVVCGPQVEGHRVITSSLDLPFLRSHYRKLFPLYPFAVNSLELEEDYDLLISSESGPAKGIRKPPHLPHLCYVHTPMRYCWGYTEHYLRTLPQSSRSFVGRQFERLRKWDIGTVENVDLYLANSFNVSDRVARYYRKKAEVVYPPVSLDLFEKPLNEGNGSHYLCFGALVPYKRIDLAIDTFNQTGEPLVVVGDGSEREKLQRRARPNIRFTGALPWAAVRELIGQSRALLFPGEEDFGIVPLEVMASGLPVIAYRKGGALETVVDKPNEPEKSSGVFFSEQSVDCLGQAIKRFEKGESRFDPAWIRRHARQFGEDHFKRKFSQAVLQVLNNR